MKRIIRVCLSLTALWVLGACGNTNTSRAQNVDSSESQLNKIFIQGAKIVQQITDERVIEAVREEYVNESVFAPHLPVTIEAVQVEEFEGYQFLVVIAYDKEGSYISSSRDYTPDSMPGYTSESGRQ